MFAQMPAMFVFLQQGAREQLDPWKLILEATIVVKLIILLLAIMFFVSLFIMASKIVRILVAQSASSKFLKRFWQADQSSDWTTDRLEGVYGAVKAFSASPLAAVFRQGYVELARTMGAAQSARGGGDQGDIDNVQRALRRTANYELTSLETMLPFLATTASTAPFIGLFGTVWGIMNAFVEIRNQGSAGIDAVAPGIAEALIVTAIGLATAIPSVMAYNFFVRRIRVLEAEMEAFSNDYLNIVRRHFLRS